MKKTRKPVSLVVLVFFIAGMLLNSFTSFSAGIPAARNSAVSTSKNANALTDFTKGMQNLKAAEPTAMAIPTVPTFDNGQTTGLIPDIDIQGSASAKKASKKDNGIIVKYKDINKAEDSKKKLTSKKPSLKLKSKKTSKRFKMETLQVSGDEDITSIIKELEKDSNVEYAQEDFVLDTFLTPQNERFGEQWGLLNNGQTVGGQTGTAHMDINAVNAWDITTGTNETVVAVIDTGTDITHSNLKDNIYINTKEQLDGVDNDQNGLVDDIQGWNIVDNNSNVFTSESLDLHGTHVSGIIAGKMGNSGITGTAPNVKILPLKFINGNTGSTSDAIAAIDYAISLGTKIISCSRGGLFGF